MSAEPEAGELSLGKFVIWLVGAIFLITGTLFLLAQGICATITGASLW